jgi:hypothetical protein
MSCARGQMENLIKLHKTQPASDRMSYHRATANQMRLVFHTAAYWLMLAVHAAIPQPDPLTKAEFATIRMRLIKSGERVARIRIQLQTSCPVILRRRAPPRAIQRMSGGASCPDAPPSETDQPKRVALRIAACRAGRSGRCRACVARTCEKWCMIRAKTARVRRRSAGDARAPSSFNAYRIRSTGAELVFAKNIICPVVQHLEALRLRNVKVPAAWKRYVGRHYPFAAWNRR